MHGILAENIDGWLIGAAAFFGGLLASVLALCALVPACQRKRAATFALAAPAFVVGVLATAWVGYGYITTGLHDSEYDVSDFLIPWLCMAAPSLTTSLLAVLVLGLCMRRSPVA